MLKFLWQSRIPFLRTATLPKTDIYLATTEMMPLHQGIKRVAIIHDLTPAVIPQFFPEPRDRYLKRMRALIENCHKIIAVSQTTANNISKFCHIRNDRIAVIYAGLPSMPAVVSSHHSIIEQLGVKRPYVLYVGALAPNKNVEGTIRCFGRFARKTAFDWQLVLVGKSFMPKGYYEKIAKDEGIIDRVVFTGWLNEEKWALYRNAELLIHLSWYEGFPLPILEAMAHGLPVLVSNRGPFPEAIQNTEQVVDPENENQVFEKLARFAQDPAVRSRWKEYMIKRANDFNWEKSAQKLLTVLRTVDEIKGAAPKTKG